MCNFGKTHKGYLKVDPSSATVISAADETIRHRFSAFWLRSKCSICSYQLNIWYVPHWGTTILNWFLELGEDAGACSDFPTGWPGLAVPPGTAHSPRGVITNKWNSPWLNQAKETYCWCWSRRIFQWIVFRGTAQCYKIIFVVKGRARQRCNLS